MYFNRHWRAYTIPRFGLFTFGSFMLMQHGAHQWLMTFPNLRSYAKFSDHPSYKLLGPVYSYFYLVRPMFCKFSK